MQYNEVTPKVLKNFWGHFIVWTTLSYLECYLVCVAANQVTVTEAVVDLGNVWEELRYAYPVEWECSLHTRVWV